MASAIKCSCRERGLLSNNQSPSFLAGTSMLKEEGMLRLGQSSSKKVFRNNNNNFNGLRLKLEKIGSNYDSSSMKGADNTIANSFLKTEILSE